MTKTITCRNNLGEYEEIPIEKIVFRPSAYGIICFHGKIITLTNKSNGKLWFPGGGVNIGEKLIDGLKREIAEETGIRVKVGKMILAKENFFYYKPADEAYHALLFFYLCEPEDTRLIADDQVDDVESEKPRWTNISEIKITDISDLADDIFPLLGKIG